MKVTTVIPLAKGIFKDELTYFTSKEVVVGMIVSIPIRKKNIDALVVDVADLSEVKADVKSSNFNLRKINRVKGQSIFSNEFFDATKEIKKYSLGTQGQIIYSLTPNFIFEEYEKIYKPKIEDKPASTKAMAGKQEKLLFQAPFEDRLTYYKTFIRESFAQKKSIFICLPTIHELNAFADILKKGVENYTYIFNGTLTSKEQTTRYNKMMKETHSVLIIGTGQYLFIPRKDISVYILERESSPGYKMMSRPFFDVRVFLEIYSKLRGVKLIFADSLLRTETIWRHSEGEFGEISPLGYRIEPIIDSIIDMKEDISGNTRKFSVLSNEIKEIIKQNLEHKKHTFLFALRKGLATITTCRDCDTVVLCDKCNSPLILHAIQKNEGPEHRIFNCPICKIEKNPYMVCRICGSWNLVPMGIGTELVENEIKKEFPTAPVFRIDKDSIKTPKQALTMVADFYKQGGILIGTELALFHLTEKVENVIVVSFDSLFNLPSFRMHEKIIQLLIILSSYSEKKVIVQTRFAENNILQPLVIGNLINFYREEIAMREQFQYPPFVTLIKLSYSGKSEDVEQAKSFILEHLADYKPKVFRAMRNKTGLVSINVALKIPRASWLIPAIKLGGSIDHILHSLLSALPQSWTIQIDPEDLV